MRASTRAYEHLREEIVTWRLLPGTPLAEVEQAARLGVSRTPLREALARLREDGLVEAQSGRGLVVTAVTTRDVEALFEVRLALEGAAVALAARRGEAAAFEVLAGRFADAGAPADEDGRRAYYDLVAQLDAAVDEAAGNAHLAGALRGLRTHLARVRRLSQEDAERLTAAAAEHRLIAEAIAAGDADLARHATHVHLHASLRRIRASGALPP